jgi:hypothetical protein
VSKPRIHKETVIALVLGLVAGAAAFAVSDSGDSSPSAGSLPATVAVTPSVWAERYCAAAVDVYDEGYPSLMRVIAANDIVRDRNGSEAAAARFDAVAGLSYTAVVRREFAGLPQPTLSDSEASEYASWQAENAEAIDAFGDALNKVANVGEGDDSIDEKLSVRLPFAGGSASYQRLDALEVQGATFAPQVYDALVGPGSLPESLRRSVENEASCERAFATTALALQ